MLLPLILSVTTWAPVLELQHDQSFAIQDVSIVTTQPTQVLPHQTVLISDRRIQAIGDSKLLPIPEGFVRLNGRGKYLTAGYCDAHAHFPGLSGLDMPAEDYLWMMLANGISRLRCMRLDPGLAEWSEKVEQGSVAGPHIHHPLAMLSGGPDGTSLDALEELLQSDQCYPDSFLKMFGGFDEASYRIVMALAQKNGVEVAGHLPRGVDLTLAAEVGQIGIEHLRGFPLAGPLDQDDIRQRVEHEVAVGSFHCPTVLWYSVQGGNQSLEELVRLPGITCLPEKLRQSWRQWRENPDEDGNRSRLQPYGANMTSIVGIMAQQGARLLLSASDGIYVVPGFSLHQEIAIYIEAGVSPQAILQAATSHAASFFGAQSDWGDVRVGQLADLVLLDANPLQDAQNLAKIAGVMVSGRYYSSERLDEELQRIAQSHVIPQSVSE